MPDFLRVVDGNRGRRPGGRGKGSAPKGKPMPPPVHLTEAAKRAWVAFERVLREMGVFRADYAIPLECACELYGDVVDLQRVIREKGRFYETTARDGAVMIRPHPAAGQLADVSRRLATYLSEFGLTPAGRAKLLATRALEGDGGGTSDEAFFEEA